MPRDWNKSNAARRFGPFLKTQQRFRYLKPARLPGGPEPDALIKGHPEPVLLLPHCQPLTPDKRDLVPNPKVHSMSPHGQQFPAPASAQQGALSTMQYNELHRFKIGDVVRLNTGTFDGLVVDLDGRGNVTVSWPRTDDVIEELQLPEACFILIRPL